MPGNVGFRSSTQPTYFHIFPQNLRSIERGLCLYSRDYEHRLAFFPDWDASFKKRILSEIYPSR
ncbi:hypothetical protein NUACC26_009890 [Scytonema sp. NUACC26]